MNRAATIRLRELRRQDAEANIRAANGPKGESRTRRVNDERDRQTLRVATAGGTRVARVAGPSTASWPSSHRQRKPTGT